MPISGGKYVSPTWHNNAAPALDAAELQAMTDTIEENQESISEILNDGICHIGAGSYIGTGGSGSGSPTVINFDTQPKIVFIQEHDPNYEWGYMMSAYGAPTAHPFPVTGTSSNNVPDLTLSWSATRLSFYGEDAEEQFNRSGKQYDYVYLA